ncbi:hypothetical protein K458DRAFT_382043 [Lentithecium fluviatile CBS 122367]|uniref:Uncharacterized protein n=1 Tax=Lentithecium fluviatile CBS 122367 TaxID=1168545 RepID=A0A6G1JQ24_9PLEO|nr:hypothetical protein K458DRAFT_382043 [Lentithecium fluviatile CBS 122367]
MCRTCDLRNHAVHTHSTGPALLDVCLITLHFTTPLSNANSTLYLALNAVLNNITDAAESTSHPSIFTTWSPCLTNPKVAAILTTASDTCRSATSPIFEPVLRHLSTTPSVQHVYLDYSIVSLAASSPESRIPCDTIILSAPNPSVAGAIGKRFGWDPKRSSLSAQMEVGAPGAFNKPGDLIRDFWAWAELHPDAPISPSSSVGSGYESVDARPVLMSTNSDEKNMSLFYAEDEERRNMEDETLIMIFQWSSHVDADRFKHPLQKSYGQNGTEISYDMWDRHVAHPVRQLKGVGAKVDMLKLELRGVEPRIETSKAAAKERSGSRRLSTMASGFGERVGGTCANVTVAPVYLGILHATDSPDAQSPSASILAERMRLFGSKARNKRAQLEDLHRHSVAATS